MGGASERSVDTEHEPGEAIEIVAPETTDAEAIVECWVDLAAEQREYGSDLASEANREPIHATVLRHIVSGTVFVARSTGGSENDEPADSDTVDGETIRGFVTFEAETGRYEETVERGIVQNLYVRPTDRDRGIGGRLLVRAEEALAASGAEVVTLEAMAANESARRFYERAGYDPHRVTLRKPLESDTHSKE